MSLFLLPPSLPRGRALQGLTRGSRVAGSGVTVHSGSDRVSPSPVEQQASERKVVPGDADRWTSLSHQRS